MLPADPVTMIAPLSLSNVLTTLCALMCLWTASPQAAGSGFVSPSVVNAAVDCLTRGTSCGSFHPPQTWPGLRGVMTWSISWDKTNGFAFSTSVKGHLKTLP